LNSSRLIAGLALLGAAATLLAGCGGGGSSSAAAKAEIKANWETFFDGATPAAKRVELLQNGAEFKGLVDTLTANPLARSLKATVTSVDVTGSDKATVTYTLIFNGNPVLKGAKGTAVLANGTWKVGTGSFCQLLALQGATPKGCPAAAK
jgi:ABC-type oligopeptide transport system substrate-binding subunit